MDDQGHIAEYPCACSNASGICWIVRHPLLSPPISFPTVEDAHKELKKLRRKAARLRKKAAQEARLREN
jgi:hypothetical protein